MARFTSTSLSAQPPRFTRRGSGARAIVIDGPDRGSACEVGGSEVKIGSAQGADLVISDPSVSREHVRVRWIGDAVEVVDAGSKNGVFVAGARLYRGEVPCGSELRLGNVGVKLVPAEEALDPELASSEALGALVGRSAAMRQLFTLIEQVAVTNATVLIEGETGVGKELVAEEIHRRSRRAARPFAVFDGGAVSEELVESTLFGHLRGSFTGAIADRAGVFTEADGGTVFLDEIGELPLELQPVLLRAVDRGMVRPVGAVAYRTVDVRVIAATHRRLDALIDRGDFREDLFYRLAVVRVVVPPLRERPEDIEPLARAILAGAGRPGLEIVPATLETLRAHDWPGNVRELRNVIDAALALAPHADELVLREIPRRGRRAEAAAAELRPFRDAKAAAVEAFERAYLTDLVQRYPTITAAADAAGMDRKHLRGLLGRFDLRIR